MSTRWARPVRASSCLPMPIGSNMALRLEQAGKTGVIYGFSYDAYWPGGTKNTAWWKNISGLLTEVASARLATPITIAPGELPGGRKGLVEYGAQTNFPNPWPGGTWRLRDIMDYERLASDALLETCSERREDFLRDMAARSRAAIAAARPNETYRIPMSVAGQRDRATAIRLARLMADHGVQVQEAGNGDIYIPLAQPYGKFVSEMFSTQRYPEVKLVAGKEIVRPYDVAAWTLPLMMGVAAASSASGKFSPGLAVAAVSAVPSSAEKLSAPRVGLYKPWAASMDEGWTRWLLEQYGFDPRPLDNKTIRAGNLSEKFDAIVLPDVEKEVIDKGRPRREEG